MHPRNQKKDAEARDISATLRNWFVIYVLKVRVTGDWSPVSNSTM